MRTTFSQSLGCVLCASEHLHVHIIDEMSVMLECQFCGHRWMETPVGYPLWN
jgi:hypothetical protein